MSDHYSHRHSDCDNPKFQDHFSNEQHNWPPQGHVNGMPSHAFENLHDVPLIGGMKWVSPTDTKLEIKELKGCSLFVGIIFMLISGFNATAHILSFLTNKNSAHNSTSEFISSCAFIIIFIILSIGIIISSTRNYIKPTYIYFNLQNQTLEVTKSSKKTESKQIFDLQHVIVDLYTTTHNRSTSHHIRLKDYNHEVDIFNNVSFFQHESQMKVLQSLIHAARS